MVELHLQFSTSQVGDHPWSGHGPWGWLGRWSPRACAIRVRRRSAPGA